jgi:hypothetical protein
MSDEGIIQVLWTMSPDKLGHAAPAAA